MTNRQPRMLPRTIAPSLKGALLVTTYMVRNAWGGLRVATVFRLGSGNRDAGGSCRCAGCRSADPQATGYRTGRDGHAGTFGSSRRANHPGADFRWVRRETDSRSPNGAMPRTGGCRAVRATRISQPVEFAMDRILILMKFYVGGRGANRKTAPAPAKAGVLRVIGKYPSWRGEQPQRRKMAAAAGVGRGHRANEAGYQFNTASAQGPYRNKRIGVQPEGQLTVYFRPVA